MKALKMIEIFETTKLATTGTERSNFCRILQFPFSLYIDRAFSLWQFIPDFFLFCLLFNTYSQHSSVSLGVVLIDFEIAPAVSVPFVLIHCFQWQATWITLWLFHWRYHMFSHFSQNDSCLASPQYLKLFFVRTTWCFETGKLAM